LALGLGGGAGAACLVLLPPLALGAARLQPVPAQPGSLGAVAFLAFVLAMGATGEELLFRGYGLQVLINAVGPWAAVLPVGVLFALLHGGNPHATWFGIANTAGFGVLFGFAYCRTRDLWLPIGLHFGWNFALPLLGANLSGLTMSVTGRTLVWKAGEVWSGGAYGPEASLLTSVALVVLWVYIGKVPLCRQASPIAGPAAEDTLCEPSRSLPS
jgi:hypothetical protein